jgi:hypothetical protein
MRHLPIHKTPLLSLLLAVSAWPARAEDRTFDGTNNHATLVTRGAANTPMIRFGYGSEFATSQGGMITDAVRTNARTISNALFAQSGGVANARNLSDFAWAWGQFLSHDTDLITASNGPQVNGTAPISIADALDPLGPNAIPFTRAIFVELPPARFSERSHSDKRSDELH